MKPHNLAGMIMMICLVNSHSLSARVIDKSCVVAAPVDSVWNAWTTKAGVQTFFAPDCNIALEPEGAYEMYFDKNAEPGKQGSEGCVIKLIKPVSELHFTWNAPPHLPVVREQHTLVKLYFKPVGENETEVRLVHEGWGEGEEWDKAFDYFNAVWSQVVLARLQYRFINGPIDWDNPPPM